MINEENFVTNDERLTVIICKRVNAAIFGEDGIENRFKGLTYLVIVIIMSHLGLCHSKLVTSFISNPILKIPCN